MQSENVWRIEAGEKIRVTWQLMGIFLVSLVPIILTATLGTITLGPGDAIVPFWPAAALQTVNSIWFGIFGAAAGVVGPMIGNGMMASSPYQFLAANIIQSSLAGLWFRRFRLDPRLRSRRDWIGLLLGGCVGAHGLGAIVGVAELMIRHEMAGDLQTFPYYTDQCVRWFLGNCIPAMLLAPALMKAASEMFIRAPSFCQSFFGSVDRHRRFRFHYRDVSITGKLLILVTVAGIGPLSAVGTWTIIDTLEGGRQVAAFVNDRGAHFFRDEIDRHELLLQLWARQLDDASMTPEQRENRLDIMRKEPDTFKNLKLIDPKNLPTELSSVQKARLDGGEVVFVRLDPAVYPELQDVLACIKAPLKEPLTGSNGKLLAGICLYHQAEHFSEELSSMEGCLVLDERGRVVFRYTSKSLAQWTPTPAEVKAKTKTLQLDQRQWYIARAKLPRLKLTVIAMTPVSEALATVLKKIPNPVAFLANLAIFGSLIFGCLFARNLGLRALNMAKAVRESGAQPGKLNIAVRGHDELGQLAGALNQMSCDLAENIRKLQETTAEKERLAKEIELARQVQLSILPSEPIKIPGYDLAALSIPAREVGGDFFDYFQLEDGRVGFMIGDATGKGLPAAMYMTQIRSIVRAAAVSGDPPGEAITRANHAASTDHYEYGNFVTLFYGLLDPAEGVIDYTNAGHERPLITRDGSIIELDTNGCPLAVTDEFPYATSRIDLKPGERIVVFSDGVTEAMNAKSELFTQERLNSTLRGLGDCDAQGAIDAILDATRRWADGVEQSDDTTLIVLTRPSVS